MGLLGSTTQLTDSAGNVTDSYTYDAFGAITSHTGTSPQPFTFTGQQQDTNAACGLLYLRARSYDPGLGRFVSQDPLPFMQRYAYAGSDPVNLIDPSGLCWVCDVGTVIGHGARSISQKAVDQLPSEKAIIAGVQIGSLVVLKDCGIAAETGLAEEAPEISGPVCGAAALTYSAAFAAQYELANSAHERIVTLASLGLADIANEVLAPLADPRRAEASANNTSRPKEGGIR